MIYYLWVLFMKWEVIYQELLLDLNNSMIKYEIDKALDDIYSDKELIKLIELYHKNNSDSIRLSIYNNEKFKKYKTLENEFNMLILELNKIFLNLRSSL